MSIAYKISSYNRKRKWKIFLREMGSTPDTKVLDVGFEEDERSSTSNFIEKNYPFPRNITALGVEEPKKFLERYPDVRVVVYDGRKFPFEPKSFDVCWSNAVLEHVGGKERQIEFLKEIVKVAKTAFITTPNRHFPVEVHTRSPLLHFLPKKFFDRYLSLIGKEWATGDYMNLLTLKDVHELLAGAGISQYKIIKHRLFFFTYEFIIIFGDIQANV
ncbi:MAG: class I SAM-dependent methyltransferase [Candidatus Omnitrophica bacterium]|nr:class I SAM-dependent methyltransferase [Candidatus Omnitrophota bacterium]